MYVYSKWILTDRNRESVTAFTNAIGMEGPAEAHIEEDQLVTRLLGVPEESQDSEWSALKIQGQWIVGVADLDAHDSFGSRLVGVISPSASMTHQLWTDLHDRLTADGAMPETAFFSLRSFLWPKDGQEAGHPMSVRLADEKTVILVRSYDQAALKEALARLNGDPVGVTMDTSKAEGQVTVTEDGQVIFTDSTSVADILVSMRTITIAVQAPRFRQA